MSTSVPPYPLVSFILRASSGMVDFGGFFPGKTVKVDPLFRRFVEMVGHAYSTPNYVCDVYQTVLHGSNDDFIAESLKIKKALSPNQVCVLLSHLGGKGQSLLEIPEGKKEVNVILGYIVVDNVEFVFYVEHEVEEIHLHAHRLNMWGDDTPMVIVLS